MELCQPYRFVFFNYKQTNVPLLVNWKHITFALDKLSNVETFVLFWI